MHTDGVLGGLGVYRFSHWFSSIGIGIGIGIGHRGQQLVDTNFINPH